MEATKITMTMLMKMRAIQIHFMMQDLEITITIMKINEMIDGITKMIMFMVIMKILQSVVNFQFVIKHVLIK